MMWKEAVITYFKTLFHIYLEELKKTLIQDRWIRNKILMKNLLTIIQKP